MVSHIFPSGCPAPPAFFNSSGFWNFYLQASCSKFKHFMASGQKRARDCHQQFRASHICYKEFLCMSGYTDCFIFFHFLMLIKIRRSAIARPIRSVTVPGMNINRPPTIKAVRSRIFSFHSNQPWKAAEITAVPTMAETATEIISTTLPCIIIASL